MQQKFRSTELKEPAEAVFCSEGQDPLYEKAKLVARRTDKLCIANIQRTLMIGYNRASRLMEAMIEDGIVERYDTGYGGIGYRLLPPNM